MMPNTSLPPLANPKLRPARVAVFRALQLGDMLCSVPALRALRRNLPQAHITLIGLPSAAPFVQRFSQYLDGLLLFPGAEGMPEQQPNHNAWPEFLQRARESQFDLIIQMHGSGELSNDLCQQICDANAPGLHDARAPIAQNITGQAATRAAGGNAPDGNGDTAAISPTDQTATAGLMFTPHDETLCGFVPPHSPVSELFLPWPTHLPEVQRYTALMRHLGFRVDDESLEFPLYASDTAECDAVLHRHGIDPDRAVILHPGARLPSRRWPPTHFASIGRSLTAAGWQLLVTGSEDEAPITRQLLRALPAAADLTGQTSLGGLAALVSRCRLVICNDTGISHVAAAVQTPSVVIACGSDVHRWAPLNRALHHVIWHNPPCRPCAWHDCPHPGHPCASAIMPGDVMRVVSAALPAGALHA